MTAPTKESWHLDKKVPITLIVALLVQTVGVVAAFVDLKKDVEYLRAQVITQRDRDDRQDKVLGDVVARLEAQLVRMDSKLDRLIEKRP